MNPKTTLCDILGDLFAPQLTISNAQNVNIVKLYLRGREMFYAQN
jgi:hypothetical protein